MKKFIPEQIASLNAKFELSAPQEIITWAVETFGSEVVMSSSFQTQSLPLLHMVTAIYPSIRIFFLNTGYHFWETLIFREQLAREYNLNLIDLTQDSSWSVFHQVFGRDLPESDSNLCCFIHKVQPMQKALAGAAAWITGIRHDQTKNRARAHVLEQQEDGLLKVNPLLNWTRIDVEAYRIAHELPEHPLAEKGYRSIGCAPCTRPVGVGEDERAGRWSGRGKTECGLHTAMFQQKGIGASEVQSQFSLMEHETGD